MTSERPSSRPVRRGSWFNLLCLGLALAATARAQSDRITSSAEFIHKKADAVAGRWVEKGVVIDVAAKSRQRTERFKSPPPQTGWCDIVFGPADDVLFVSWELPAEVTAPLVKSGLRFKEIVAAFKARGFRELNAAARTGDEIIFGSIMDHPGSGALIATRLQNSSNTVTAEVILLIPYRPGSDEAAVASIRVDISAAGGVSADPPFRAPAEKK